jgi:hypothetical protein
MGNAWAHLIFMKTIYWRLGQSWRRLYKTLTLPPCIWCHLVPTNSV